MSESHPSLSKRAIQHAIWYILSSLPEKKNGTTTRRPNHFLMEWQRGRKLIQKVGLWMKTRVSWKYLSSFLIMFVSYFCWHQRFIKSKPWQLWLFSMRWKWMPKSQPIRGFRNVSNYSSRMPMERINWSKMHDLISSERNASLRQHSDNSTSLKTPETLTVLNDSELSCFSHAHSRCLTMPPAWAPKMTMLILLL